MDLASVARMLRSGTDQLCSTQGFNYRSGPQGGAVTCADR